MNILAFTTKQIRGGLVAGLLLCLGLAVPFASAEHFDNEQSFDLSYPPSGNPTFVVNVEAGEVNGGDALSPEQTKQREQSNNHQHFILDSKFRLNWPDAPTEILESSIPAPAASSPAAQKPTQTPDQPDKDTLNQSG